MNDIENNELRMVQLHTMITEQNEQLMNKLQGKILMEKGKRISKGHIINAALHDYLTYALEQDGK